MTRLLLCALIAMSTAVACGKKPADETATTPESAQQAAPPASVPAPEAEPLQPPAELQPVGESDGETVDAGTTTTSPVAAAVASNTPAAPATEPLRWKKGENYTEFAVAQPVSTAPGSVEVLEGFWYGCPHCFELEPQLVAWEGSKPAWVQLKRLPVIFNEVTREDARLYFTIEGLGLVDKLHSEVFREIHVRGRPLTVVRGNRVDIAATEKSAREFLMSHGVSAEDFARHYRTFSTENKLRQAENLAHRYQLDHTPIVVVQGKYVTDVGMAGGRENLIRLINDLAARERGAS
ncbi:MAG: thiol:disulfide interchange protein DsbA/DsbL [Gammaproteobacteria bacterium]|nr:thiol:disulfide interchange protein DsbA/DsbL [Gammaproteobacteria bacterium]